MVGCSIKKCKSRSVKGGPICFFAFPSNESVAKEWLRYCGHRTTIKNGRVCSIHFIDSDYLKPLKYILMNESPRKVKRLKPEAIPSLFIDNVNEQHDPVLKVLSREQINNEVATTSESISKINPDTNNTIVTSSIAATTMVVCSPDIQTIRSDQSDDQVTISLPEYKLLNSKFRKYKELKNNLKKIFTPGQIKCLMKPQSNKSQRVKWSSEDIAAAITLRSISPKSYHYLRNTVGMPLPGYSTLCKWVCNSEGKLKNESK